MSAPSSSPTPIHELLLPLADVADLDRAARSGTVLAAWFGVTITMLTTDPGMVTALWNHGSDVGIRTEPLLADGPSLAAAAAATADERRPCLVFTTSARLGLDIAARTEQPTYLSPTPEPRRLPSGPLVVAVTGSSGDTDAVALAALWSRALGHRVQLVTPPGRPVDVGPLLRRVTEMGLACDTDTADLVAMAVDRSAMATVVPATAEAALVASLLDAGVPVVVAGASRRPADTEPVAHEPAGLPLHVLDEATCRTRLASRTVGRLGYVHDGRPVIVPVNYRADGDRVVIRSLPGGKVGAAWDGEDVCLQIDDWSVDGRTGWSVLGSGTLRPVDTADGLAAAWATDPRPFAGGDEWTWLELAVREVSGRAVGP